MGIIQPTIGYIQINIILHHFHYVITGEQIVIKVLIAVDGHQQILSKISIILQDDVSEERKQSIGVVVTREFCIFSYHQSTIKCKPVWIRKYFLTFSA